MTNSTRPTEPTHDDSWFTFASHAKGIDPNETITTRSLGVALSRDMGVALPAPEPPVTSLPELSYSSVEPNESARPSGTQVDFEVTGILGEGGMGRVLLARQKSLRREVALKVLKPKAANREVVDSLLSEAIVTGSVEHPSVVPIHALGRDAEGRPVLVMKRIEGVSWRDLARDPAHPMWATLAPEEGDRLDAHLDILMSVCNAVHFAHSRGFVHRDIKLANVMIGGFGEVYIVDWGIATRMAAPGERNADETTHEPPLGTPSYMAPEMAVGDRARIDARTDVYLLGATLHALLTGKPRHVGETLLDVLLSARASLPFDYGPDIHPELAAICNRAMHVDPEMRFRSALELRQAISAFRRHRVSITLGNQASSRLDEIDALLASRARGALAPEDDRLVHKWMTECRFGFMQALDAWKGNHAARLGLDRCLLRMIEHEIAQRDDEGARALLAELEGPRPDLERRIDALRAELAEARAREEKLRSMERDADPTVSARPLFALLAVVPAYALFAALFLYGRGMKTLAPWQLTVAAVVFLTVLSLAFVAARRRLQTAISRRTAGIVLLVPAAMLLHRAIAMMHDAPISSTLVNDLLLAAVVSSAGGITVLPRFWWVTLPSVMGAIAIASFPERAVDVFAATSAAAVATLIFVWVRTVQARTS